MYRIYRALELNLRIKPKKRMVREKPATLTVPASINQVWSMDFLHEQLRDGRCIRLFNVIDDFVDNYRNREALGIDVDFSLPSERVIRSLDQIISWRGYPSVIRCDNGPEYISAALQHCRVEQTSAVSGSNISCLETRSKMPMWSDSTEPCAVNGVHNT